jgi:predicted unusual protein kinase regulating ubiquinone biosynthesis (AarF/ABC1/UbiB family)
LSVFYLPMITFFAQLWLDRRGGRSAQNEAKRAIQLRKMLTKLGPAYIKIGQALSTRP